MPITFNLRHLEEDSLQLVGEMPPAELELETMDELIKAAHPLVYDLEVQMLDTAILVRGRLELNLDCECVRCLKPFSFQILLPEWACHLPMEGDDKVPVVNDCVDLTPHIREDIVLAFPQHPLCDPECSGLAGSLKKKGSASKAAKPDSAAAWAVLDKLKLKN
jgi:uncharacterized protein